MKKVFISTATLSAIALAASAQAAVVFNDTFDSGTSSWFASRASSTVSNVSQSLSLATTSTATDHRILGKGFSTQSLANDGDVLRLTFDLKQLGAVTLFRVGLFSIANTPATNDWNNSFANVGATSLYGSAYAGYYSLLYDNAASNITRRDESTGAVYNNGGNAPTLQTDATISGAAPAAYNIANDASITYQVLFELTRVNSTTVNTLTTMSDGTNTVSFAGAHAVTPYTTFNSVFLQSSSGTASTTTTFDNIKLEYIVPEPTSLAFLGLGGLALTRRRR